MALKPVSISQLNDYISRVLGTDPLLSNVRVRGELYGVKYHSSGHIYCTMIDSFSRIRCFISRDRAAELRYRLADGMEVTVTAAVNVYKKGGTYSLSVKMLEAGGSGSLQIAFEEMKAKLDKEGLFDPAHKKPIPEFPARVAVVTSGTGAAIRDILKNITARNRFVDVRVVPVLVQGAGAAAQIAGAIDYLNENFSDIDVMIVGRGGGSPEDLCAFNEEMVARSIYNSEIPVISAVGHEIDFTIADMVSDVRAETPTKAGVLAVPDVSLLETRMNELISGIRSRLISRIDYNRMKAENIGLNIRSGLREKLKSERDRLEKYRIILETNDPRSIMKSGYSILSDDDGHMISDAARLETDKEYLLTLYRGRARVRITSLEISEDQV